MKKLFSLSLVFLIVTGFFIFNQNRTSIASDKSECQLYFVDRQLHRLVPTVFIPEKSPEKTAKKMVSELILGRDKNNAILRIIPNIEDGISVKVKGDTAQVNLLGDLAKHINKNAETEKLFIYQIVNSLTSVDGIKYVRFTIDSETKKDFVGFLDMREIFTADYDI